MSSAHSGPLRGLKILVTRPAPQAQPLCEQIEAEGGTVLRVPTVEIQPPDDEEKLRRLLSAAERFEIALFVSPNAVERGLAYLLRYGSLPAHWRVGAVGGATAEALRARRVRVDIIPENGFNSEALLAHPALQNIQDHRILIFRGQGGRELLAQSLGERGAYVEYAEVYRRTRPPTDAESLCALWQTPGVDLVTVTSSEILENLAAMLGPPGKLLLHKTALLVVSERIAQQARAMGIREVFVAPSPAPKGIVQRILAWRETTKR